MSDLVVSVTFTENTGDDPATGLALADIDLYLTAVNISTGAETVVWNGTQNPTAEIDDMGAYIRIYDSADLNTYIYFARGTYTGATVLDSDTVTGIAGESAETIWTYSPRTLTQSGTSVVAAVSGGTISITRGDTLSASITGLGSLVGFVSLDWSVKDNLTDSDDDAIIRIRLNASGLDDGLLRINGAAAPDATKGSITIDDAGDGDITIALAADITDDLEIRDHDYDIQLILAASVTTLSIGTATVVADVTRAVT